LPALGLPGRSDPSQLDWLRTGMADLYSMQAGKTESSQSKYSI
jgi:hypothetical protein